MKKIIVTTTISSVTEASIKYSEMDGWDFLVVADKKTPLETYKDIDCEIMTVEDQDENWKKLSDLIGWNCAERKTLGVIEAYKRGYDVIAIVDDDNVPLDNWGKNLIVGTEVQVNYCQTDDLCFDPLYKTNYPHLWHRGFPLQLLQQRKGYSFSKKKVFCDVQSGLWNGDPDIDSVCRMEHAPECVWDTPDFPIATNTFSPYNSQNTILSRKAVREYFMMPRTGRMTDIWSSFYNQSHGMQVVYTKADVRHDRHPHDATVDFKDEVCGNVSSIDLMKDLKRNPSNIGFYLSVESNNALIEYREQIRLIDGDK